MYNVTITDESITITTGFNSYRVVIEHNGDYKETDFEGYQAAEAREYFDRAAELYDLVELIGYYYSPDYDIEETTIDIFSRI